MLEMLELSSRLASSAKPDGRRAMRVSEASTEQTQVHSTYSADPASPLTLGLSSRIAHSMSIHAQ
jgi:hypothetical protein